MMGGRAVPTDQEVKDAEDVLARRQAAKVAARSKAMAPLLAILRSDDFNNAVTQVEELADDSVKSHLMAVRLGAEQLVRIGQRDEAAE